MSDYDKNASIFYNQLKELFDVISGEVARDKQEAHASRLQEDSKENKRRD